MLKQLSSARDCIDSSRPSPSKPSPPPSPIDVSGRYLQKEKTSLSCNDQDSVEDIPQVFGSTGNLIGEFRAFDDVDFGGSSLSGSSCFLQPQPQRVTGVLIDNALIDDDDNENILLSSNERFDSTGGASSEEEERQSGTQPQTQIGVLTLSRVSSVPRVISLCVTPSVGASGLVGSKNCNDVILTKPLRASRDAERTAAAQANRNSEHQIPVLDCDCESCRSFHALMEYEMAAEQQLCFCSSHQATSPSSLLKTENFLVAAGHVKDSGSRRCHCMCCASLGRKATTATGSASSSQGPHQIPERNMRSGCGMLDSIQDSYQTAPSKFYHNPDNNNAAQQQFLGKFPNLVRRTTSWLKLRRNIESSR